MNKRKREEECIGADGHHGIVFSVVPWTLEYRIYETKGVWNDYVAAWLADWG